MVRTAKTRPFRMLFWGDNLFLWFLYAKNEPHFFNDTFVGMSPRRGRLQRAIGEADTAIVKLTAVLDHDVWLRAPYQPPAETLTSPLVRQWQRFVSRGYGPRWWTPALFRGLTGVGVHLPGHYGQWDTYGHYFDTPQVDLELDATDCRQVGGRPGWLDFIHWTTQREVLPLKAFMRVGPDPVRLPLDLVRWFVSKRYHGPQDDLLFAMMFILRAGIVTGVELARQEVAWLDRGGGAFEALQGDS